MVSGRHKAYESTGDSLENDAAAHSLKQTEAAHSLELTVIKGAKVNKRHITVEGQRFSRRAIDKLVAQAKDPRAYSESLQGYLGKEPAIVEAKGKKYIGLVRLKSSGGFMRFIIYDFSDEKVKTARTKSKRVDIAKEDVIDKEDPDFGSEDLLEKLEREYRER